MKKRKNRLYRWMAMVLSVALLAGQSPAFVLAEEEEEQEQCICETACTEDAVNTDCPVCAVNDTNCAGKADDAENNGEESSDTENNG